VAMRGDDGICGSLFSYIDLEKRVRADHPLRLIREIANAALKSLSGEFAKLYSPIGRESIPPERLMRALLLQAFYSIRSERQLVERIDTDLLFRWFVGLGIEDAVWDATTFTKNRDRLLDGAVAGQFLAAVLSQDKVKRLLSSEHFSVDGTLLEAWASPKSFRPKDGSGEPSGPGRNGERDFHGERRCNDTHGSTTDPDARLCRKGPGKEARLCFIGHALKGPGKEARLCFIGHALMENRNGLIVGAVTTRASGHAERLAALALIEPHADRPQPITLGADKAYDTADFCHGTAREGGNAACRAEPKRASFGDRRPHHPPSRLRRLPAHPQTRRRSLRLGQDGGRLAQDAASRPAQGRLAVHPGNGRLRSRPPAQIARRAGGVTLVARKS
jgi:transposase